MVPVNTLRDVVNDLKAYSEHRTKVSWVDWRKGFQIKMLWKGNSSFACYLDFGQNQDGRDRVLKRAFGLYAQPGSKPYVERGHGWSQTHYEFQSSEFVSVNVIHDLAKEMGESCTVLYVQECVSARPLFEALGIALVPGEMGKEWKNDAFIPYSCPQGMNL